MVVTQVFVFNFLAFHFLYDLEQNTLALYAIVILHIVRSLGIPFVLSFEAEELVSQL